MNNIILLSTMAFSAGICILLSPFMTKFVKKYDIVDYDSKLFIWAVYFIIIFAFSYYTVRIANQSPVYLTPLLLITVFFKILGPGAMARSINKSWKYPFAALSSIMAASSAYSLLEMNYSLSIYQNILMAVSSGYLFTKFYLILVLKAPKPEEYVILWFSGLLIGLSFVVLLPFLYPGFSLWYGISGLLGWSSGAYIILMRRSEKNQ